MSRRNRQSRGAHSGFTIVELMVVVALVGIVMVWGIPEFSRLTARKRAESSVAQLVSAIQLARSQAMTTGRTMTLCAVNTNTTITACSGNQSDWSSGWALIQEGTGDVLQVFNAPAGMQITGAKVEVNPNGMRAGGGAITFIAHPTSIGDTALDRRVTIEAASLSYQVDD